MAKYKDRLSTKFKYVFGRRKSSTIRFAREARRAATIFNQGGTDFLRTELYSFLLSSEEEDGVSVQNIHPKSLLLEIEDGPETMP